MMPSKLVFQRVTLPRRLEQESESGLDSLVMILTSAALSVAGFHVLGDALHALHTVSEVQDALQPEAMGQSEMLARQAFDQNVGQPTLSTPTPMVMVEAWMAVRRPINVLDPSLKVTDPSLAQIYQQRPRSLGDALKMTAPAPRQAPPPQPYRPGPLAWRVL